MLVERVVSAIGRYTERRPTRSIPPEINPISESSPSTDSTLYSIARMGFGAGAGLAVGVGVSFLTSGGTPLRELMLQASLNPHDLSIQAATSLAYIGLPLGALIANRRI